jgi:ribosome-binding protein aMBF1 (putative translation factor)
MSKLLSQMRSSKGWSRAELARRAHMSASDVGKIESGRLLPYQGQLAKLAKALGIAPADAEFLLDEHKGEHGVSDDRSANG